jgi:hypothetical protein
LVDAPIGSFSFAAALFANISLFAFAASSSSKSAADRHPSASSSAANPFLFRFFFWGAGGEGVAPDLEAVVDGLELGGDGPEVDAAGTAADLEAGAGADVEEGGWVVAFSFDSTDLLGADRPESLRVRVCRGEEDALGFSTPTTPPEDDSGLDTKPTCESVGS